MPKESIFLLIIIAIVYWIGKKSLIKLVDRIGSDRQINFSRIHYVKAVLTFGWSTVCVVVAAFIAGIHYHDLGIAFGSIFAVIGVALFAQWSILSNVTASIIVFFFFPYKVGDYVKIIDGDNTIEGHIKEISLFHVILNCNDNSTTTFPNALTFQRAVSIYTESQRLEAQEKAKKLLEQEKNDERKNENPKK